MFDRHQGGERALLLHVIFSPLHQQADLVEFRELVTSSGASVICEITSQRHSVDSKYFVGSGKVSEIKELVHQEAIDIVIINEDLSPAQERNLEHEIKARVLSRSGLILDIFASRARTFEGKLQVELAQLEHLSTRLVRGWTHLERQKGGIGLRGPGETQLETDRRLLAHRIKHIQGRLNKVQKQRAQNRKSRQKSHMPVVSIVGYTNAGKSTLFNALVDAKVYAKDRLFATLDPTMRKLHLPGFGNVILADTVGFIKGLPHQLIEAFKATLEEVLEADLLLHVIDISNPEWRQTVMAVKSVLEEIGAKNIPQVQVFNKIDCLENDYHKMGKGQDSGKSVWVSAKAHLHLDSLLTAVSSHVFGQEIQVCQKIKASDGALRSQLFEQGAVIDEHTDNFGHLWLNLKMSEKSYQSLFPT